MPDSRDFLKKFLSESSLKDAVDDIRTMERISEEIRLPLAGVTSQPARIDIEALRPPRIPTPQEANSYQSSEAIVESMAATVAHWRKELDVAANESSKKYQPTVIGFLPNGQIVQVRQMTAESFHCVRIEGTLGFDGPVCMFLAHQASIQLLCTTVEITEEKPKRTIGFVTNEKQQDL